MARNSQFACKLCKKKYVSAAVLHKHMKYHTGQGLLYCNFCGKGFNDKTNLLIHIRNHTGERPYVCELCDESFIRKDYLRKHLILDHQKSKTSLVLPERGRFKCHLCPKAFISLLTLQDHISNRHANALTVKPQLDDENPPIGLEQVKVTVIENEQEKKQLLKSCGWI